MVTQMKLPICLVGICATVAGSIACRTLEPKGKAHADHFVIPASARNVQFTNDNDGGVVFELPEPYPAAKTLQIIRDQLSAKGWKPVVEDVLNPTNRSSHATGWERHETADGQSIHQWVGAWMDPNQNVLLYRLSYKTSKGESTIEPRVEVAAAFLSPQTLSALRKAASGKGGHQ
jgi:hypothetical protein